MFLTAAKMRAAQLPVAGRANPSSPAPHPLSGIGDVTTSSRTARGTRLRGSGPRYRWSGRRTG